MTFGFVLVLEPVSAVRTAILLLRFVGPEPVFCVKLLGLLWATLAHVEALQLGSSELLHLSKLTGTGVGDISRVIRHPARNRRPWTRVQGDGRVVGGAAGCRGNSARRKALRGPSSKRVRSGDASGD